MGNFRFQTAGAHQQAPEEWTEDHTIVDDVPPQFCDDGHGELTLDGWMERGPIEVASPDEKTQFAADDEAFCKIVELGHAATIPEEDLRAPSEVPTPVVAKRSSNKRFPVPALSQLRTRIADERSRGRDLRERHSRLLAPRTGVGSAERAAQADAIAAARKMADDAIAAAESADRSVDSHPLEGIRPALVAGELHAPTFPPEILMQEEPSVQVPVSIFDEVPVKGTPSPAIAHPSVPEMRVVDLPTRDERSLGAFGVPTALRDRRGAVRTDLPTRDESQERRARHGGHRAAGIMTRDERSGRGGLRARQRRTRDDGAAFPDAVIQTLATIPVEDQRVSPYAGMQAASADDLSDVDIRPRGLMSRLIGKVRS